LQKTSKKSNLHIPETNSWMYNKVGLLKVIPWLWTQAWWRQQFDMWSVVAEWLGCRTLNLRVMGSNPGEGTAWYLWAGYLKIHSSG
jgi:hypothetical protein